MRKQMICYRDMSFCSKSAECANKRCRIRLCDKERAKAVKWWGSDDFPVSYSDFFKDCREFVSNAHMS